MNAPMGIFDYVSEHRHFISEMSTIDRFLESPEPKMSFTIQSDSGRTEKFVFDHHIYSHDNEHPDREVAIFIFEPANPELKEAGVQAVIYND